MIEDDLLCRILDECKNSNISRVALGSSGEALLHRHYVPYLRYAKSLGLWASTTTNAALLEQPMADALIREKLDLLILSVYSSDPHEHLKYTGTNTFDQVVQNIRYLLTRWRESQSSMTIKMKFLHIPGVNNHKKYARFWKPIIGEFGLDIIKKKPIDWGGRVDLLRKKPLFHRLEQRRCPHVRYYLYVLHNGDVLPCCNIPTSEGAKEILFGNLKRDRIMDIWQSERYLAFKKNHEAMQVSGYGPCRECMDIFSCVEPSPVRKFNQFRRKLSRAVTF